MGHVPTSRSKQQSSPLTTWLLAFALAACSAGDPSALNEARAHIERGDFDVAAAALADSTGPDAEQLRVEIAAGLSHREALDKSLRSLVDAAPKHDADWSLAQYKNLLQQERDPHNLERIRKSQSDLAALLAANQRKPLHTPAGDASKTGPDKLAGANHPVLRERSAPARAALAAARDAQSKKEWKTALALALDAEEDSAVSADAQLLRESILGAARADADAVLERARTLERSGAARDAARGFQDELARFPTLGEFDSLRSESQLMNKRAQQAQAARPESESQSGGEHAREVDPLRKHDGALSKASSADECAALAESRASAGDLWAARDAWLEAARRRNTSPWKEESEWHARELDLRISLREELFDFARVDAETARALGVNAGADSSNAAKFESVPLAEVSLLIERAQVSSKARLGWLIESIVRGDEHERELALSGLGDCVVRGELEPARASSLVAQAKGQVGDGGWTFSGGRWVEGGVAKAEAAAAAQTARGAKYAQLIGDFRRSNTFERDSVLALIRAQGDAELLKEALSKRWQDDWARLEKNPNLHQLTGLADKRRELDRAREKALALIFDEERYFYPYNPPECPPQKAAKYPEVQREVDELVQAVRDVWEAAKRVKLGDALRQQLAAAAWTAERAAELDVELGPVDVQWRFVLVLPAGADVGLSDFAWDAPERAALIESERIEARNERLWAAFEHAKPSDDVPNSDEQRQVRITNAYRRLLGRRALAWNPKLEAAAQGHSDHMANSGEFSHFEQGDPTRNSPFDRMRLAGYAKGVSENILMGHGDPQSAHEGWLHSSGHHRNILMADHREMASAIASSYWTQDFGTDSAFLSDL